MTNAEREALARDCRGMLESLRGDPLVPPRLFGLLDEMLRRLDRIEFGSWKPTEAPTNPDLHRLSSRELPSVTPEAAAAFRSATSKLPK